VPLEEHVLGWRQIKVASSCLRTAEITSPEQLGRWTGSVAQELNPLERAVGRAQVRASPMPDRYAQQPRVVYVIKLMIEQVAAVRALVERAGGVAKLERGFGGL
jgi:hypothetical protein